jgi:transmembrane sensor
MSIERLWTLVARKLAGEASADELNELSDLLANNSDLHLQLEAIMTAWNGVHKPDKEEQEGSYLQLINKLRDQGYEMGNVEKEIPLGIEFSKPRKRKLLRWGLATGLALIAFLGFYFILFKPKIVPARVPLAQPSNIISTKNGSRTKIQLPDGSIAWLNSGSKLTYGEQFGNKVREVELSGEAFFDVRHDETKPFIIRTPYIQVKDLGTQFNVKSYPDDKISEVSLVEGSVEVTMKKHPTTKWVLMPNDKGRILNVVEADMPAVTQKKEKAVKEEESLVFTLAKVNFDKTGEIQEVAWTKNKLAFVKERLDVIAVKMERWFDKEVIIQNKQLNSLEFSATFESESLESVLKAIQLSSGKPINFTIDAEKVTIY